MKKHVIIIDDEPLARSMVKEYLRPYQDIEIVEECNNGYEGVKAIAQHKPDLIFLDIQMPKITGFEMLELVERLPAVIFTTAFDEYALKAFEANAVDYLLKPFSKERFDTALSKWKAKSGTESKSASVHDLLSHTEKSPEERNRIVVRQNNEISIIPAKDIVYLEAYDDYVKIFTNDSYYLKKKTLSFYEDTLLPDQFFRTHRSFMINLQHLMRIEPMAKNTYVALLKSGKKIPLSRTGYANLKTRLGL